MPLEKQILSWPLLGGLSTKNAPLAQQQGTFLTLDNVRSERVGEWKNRQAITHLNDDDDVFDDHAVARMAPLPGGGAFGMAPQIQDDTAVYHFSPTQPADSRWERTTSAQTTPGAWRRRPVAAEGFVTKLTSIAEFGGYRIIAWKPGNPTNGQDSIRVTVVTVAEGITVSPVTSYGTTSATNPKCVYDPTSGVFLVFYTDGTNLAALRYNATTGQFINGGTLKADVIAGSGTQDIDAYVYSGTRVTVLYRRTATGNVIQLEVNGSTLALTTDVDTTYSASGSLALLPDPDGGAIRFIAITTATELRVLRTNQAGAVQSDDLADTVQASNVIGCAYASGAGWMVVYRDLVSGSLFAAKKRLGVISSRYTLTPGVGTSVELDSNAWREPGTDAMHYIAGIHLGGTSTSPTSEIQHSYFEMALEYENGDAQITNIYSEPQARILPLRASIPVQGDTSVVQVVRTDAGKFVLTLARFARLVIANGVMRNEYAIDMWDVDYMSAAWYASFGHPNLGPGMVGSQASYMPAGSLLTTVSGQQAVSHGLSAIPRKPSVALQAGGSLTSGGVLHFKITEEVMDETGNIWRSPQSVASNSITPTGGNLSVDVTVTSLNFEAKFRWRTVKIWRTLADGSVYQLAYQTQRLCDVAGASSFTVNISGADTALALSDFMPTGLPAAITPAFNHVANFDGRMWGAERDFPSRLRFTKIIRAGVQPEFTDEFTLDLDDEFGDITALQPLDDKLIVMKAEAIYFIAQGGPNDDGSGSTYRATRVSSETGARPGTPTLSTGEAVWMFHKSGWYTIDRALQVQFIGSAIDKWFNQPLVETPEMPLSITHSSKRNEVRILTTTYRFVYDTINRAWIRDTGGAAGAQSTFSLEGYGDMFMRSNGEVWWDYDTLSIAFSDDAAGPFLGVIRSPWMKPAQPSGYMRLYAWRSLYLRTPAVAEAQWPQMRVYFDEKHNDTTTYKPAGTTDPQEQRLEQRIPYSRRCTAFSLEVTLPPGDQEWRFNEWTVLFGISARGRFIKFGGSEIGRPNTTRPAMSDMVFWHDADDPWVTRALDIDRGGYTVSAAADRSGNGWNWEQTDVNRRPDWRPNMINGHAGIDYSYDTDVQLDHSGLVPPGVGGGNLFTPGTARSIIAVIMPSGTKGGAVACLRQSTLHYACTIWTNPVGAPAGQYVYDNGSTSITVTPVEDYTDFPMIAAWEDAGNLLVTSVNGPTLAQSSAITTPENGAGTGMTLGNINSYAGLNNSNFEGVICEVIGYDLDEIPDQTVAYLAAKYGIVVT